MTIIDTERRVISSAPISLDLADLLDRWGVKDKDSAELKAALAVTWHSVTPDFIENTLVCVVETVGGARYCLTLRDEPYPGEREVTATYAPDGSVITDWELPIGGWGCDIPYGGKAGADRPLVIGDLCRAVHCIWNAIR